MVNNSYDNIFEQHIYVTREVDNRLGMILDSFGRGQRAMRWVSVRAPQGSGRTLLLERLRRLKAESNENMLRIFVPGGESRVANLNPLAAELYSLHASDQRTVSGKLRASIRELKRRLNNATWSQIFISICIIAGCVMLACVIVGLNQYVTSGEVQLTSLDTFKTFFRTYLPNNWARLPVWLLVGSLGGLPFSLAVLYLTRNGLLPAPSELEAPGKNQIEEFNSEKGLQSSLFDLLGRKKRMVLLVDDANCLPKIEQEFLHNLFVPRVKDLFNKKGWKILIVTVDVPEFDRQQALANEMHTSFEAVEVAHFELVELQDIANSQLPADETQSEEERVNLLEQAQADVKALFAAQNRILIDEIGKQFEKQDIDGEFTPAKLLTYRLARRDYSISKGALIKWLHPFSSEDQLQIFQLTKSETDQRLVLELANSDLVETKGQTIVIDPARSEALRQWLKQNDPGLLQQTHFYWFRKALGTVNPATEARNLSSEEKEKLRCGAWHALQLNALHAIPEIIEQAPGVGANDRSKLAEQACGLLVPAIALARSEADFERADTLAWNAVQWLHLSHAPAQNGALNSAADQLWRNCLLSGDPSVRQKLDELADAYPDLIKRPSWNIYRAFDDLRRGSFVCTELPNEAQLTAPDHQNLIRLTVILRNIKQHYGFPLPALRDQDFPIPEPVTGNSSIFAEFELRALQAAAFLERGDPEHLVQAMNAWRTRLHETVPPDDLLGDKALHLYHTARYWHVLDNAWQLGLRAMHEFPEEQRNLAQEKLAALVQSLSLPTQVSADNSRVDSLREAENAYEQTRRLLVLLGWRALLSEAGFYLGALLAAHQPMDLEPEKWEWDKLFSQVLQLEAELGWLIHTPHVHRIRWEHVHALDRELSIGDAYNVYQSVLNAGYPTGVIVQWHQNTAGLLNNYGQKEEDRRRSAELQEEWARTLASNPEAQRFWTYTNLTLEQGNALMFAAQAWRWLGEFETAESRLKEAEALLNSVPPVIDKDGGDPKQRQLQIDMQLQWSWLFEAQEKVSQHRQMMRQIWRSLKFEDDIVSNVLGSLLTIEKAEGLLRKRWPFSEQQLPNVDPDNESLSLPAEWFDGPQPLQVQDLFEFRFRQLVHLVSDERQPTYEQLMQSAANHWGNREKFGEVAIKFAQTALGHTNSPGCESLMLDLLQALRTYFSQVEELDRRELEILRLLMNYKAGAKKYQADYIKVLVEFESLVEREKRIREITDTLNWPSVALWASTHLGLLTNEALLKQYLVANHMVDEFVSRREHLVKILNAASQLYDESNFSACIQEVEKLAPPNGQFVFIEDILALNLWLQCKQRLSETHTEEFNQRSTQLREAVIQYVKQLSALISDRQAQLLALNILTDLKQAANQIQTSATPH